MPGVTRATQPSRQVVLQAVLDGAEYHLGREH